MKKKVSEIMYLLFDVAALISIYLLALQATGKVDWGVIQLMVPIDIWAVVALVLDIVAVVVDHEKK